VCCSVLKCVCVLQCVTVCYSVLRCVAASDFKSQCLFVGYFLERKRLNGLDGNE